MSASSAVVEWYIARDGQQFGPVKEYEFGKLIEGGFLKPTDLIWREGFGEWRSAATILQQPMPAPVPPPPPGYSAGPVAQSAGGRANPVPERDTAAGVTRSDGHAVEPGSGQGAQGHHVQGHHAQGHYTQSERTGRNPGTFGAGHASVQPDYRQPGFKTVDGPGFGGIQVGGQVGGQVGAQGGVAAGREGPVTPETGGRAAQRKSQAGAAGGSRQLVRTDADDDEDIDDEAESEGGGARRWMKRVAIGVVVFAMAGAATWYAYPYRERIFNVASAVTSIGGGGGADKAALEAPPFKGFQISIEGTDDVLQKALLWRTLKREFPEWYANRLKDAAQQTRDKRSKSDVGRDMATSVMQLRRQHSGDALSATMPRLRAIAVAFADNLQRLRKHSVDACYGYISSGEAHPVIVGLFQAPDHSSHLQKQINAVFEAIAEGRKTPRVYAAPKQADYNLLVVELEARGWTQTDMQLFSDSKALAKAPPDKVCKLVQEWFEAQLAVKDADAQLRLIVDALKPVVAG